MDAGYLVDKKQRKTHCVGMNGFDFFEAHPWPIIKSQFHFHAGLDRESQSD